MLKPCHIAYVPSMELGIHLFSYLTPVFVLMDGFQVNSAKEVKGNSPAWFFCIISASYSRYIFL